MKMTLCVVFAGAVFAALGGCRNNTKQVQEEPSKMIRVLDALDYNNTPFVRKHRWRFDFRNEQGFTSFCVREKRIAAVNETNTLWVFKHDMKVPLRKRLPGLDENARLLFVSCARDSKMYIAYIDDIRTATAMESLLGYYLPATDEFVKIDATKSPSEPQWNGKDHSLYYVSKYDALRRINGNIDKEWIAGAFTNFMLSDVSERAIAKRLNNKYESDIVSIDIRNRAVKEFDVTPSLQVGGFDQNGNPLFWTPSVKLFNSSGLDKDGEIFVLVNNTELRSIAKLPLGAFYNYNGEIVISYQYGVTQFIDQLTMKREKGT